MNLKYSLPILIIEETFPHLTAKSDAIALYTPDRPYTMYVGKSGEKSIWMNHLKMAIARFLYDIHGSDKTSELGKLTILIW